MGHLCAQVLPTPDVHWLPDVPVQGPSHAQGVSESPPPAQCRDGKSALGPRGQQVHCPSHLSPGTFPPPDWPQPLAPGPLHVSPLPPGGWGWPWSLLAWAGGTGGTALSSGRGRDQEWMWPCPSFLHSVSLPKSPLKLLQRVPAGSAPPLGGEARLAGLGGLSQGRGGWSLTL